jgi:hypothetical protein
MVDGITMARVRREGRRRKSGKEGEGGRGREVRLTHRKQKQLGTNTVITLKGSVPMTCETPVRIRLFSGQHMCLGGQISSKP